jgi:16S rRNA (guanine527-N7)-methyltransferase
VPEPDADVLRERLDRGLALLGLIVDADQRRCLAAFVELLARWNRTYNLTAVRDPLEMVPRHILDSLAVLPYLGAGSVLDVGTGAGLPGVPLAITAPERDFVLLDSNGKKVRFVRQAVMELGLGNVTAAQARIESYRPDGKFATIVARAVAAAPEILAAVARLLARPARVLVMKGRPPVSELEDLRPLPDAVEVHRLRVPMLEGERHLIDIRYD